MRQLPGIDQNQMKRFDLDGSDKPNPAMTTQEKTTFGIDLAQAEQLKLKLEGMTQGLKGVAYQNKCDLVPLLFKYVDKGVSKYSDFVLLVANLKELKKRNPGQDRDINQYLLDPLRTLFSTDDWLQRILAGSQYGLLVSWMTLKNMLDRYVKLFMTFESEAGGKRDPSYGSYVNLMDPLTVKYAAYKADNTKKLVRKDFVEVAEEVDVYYFLNEYDEHPGCTVGNPQACKDFTLYDYTTYYPAENAFNKPSNRQNKTQVKMIAKKVFSKLEELKVLGKGTTNPVVAADPKKMAQYKKYYG